MAKYYVQSGSCRMVLDAQDAEAAALTAMHSRLADIAFIYDADSEFTDPQKLDQVLMQVLVELDTTVAVSEMGFDRVDASVYETFDLAVQWHQLACALIRLEREI